MRASLPLFVALASTAAVVGLIACSSEETGSGPAPNGDSSTSETSSGGGDGGGEGLSETLTTFCEKTYGQFKTYLSVCCDDTDRATEEYGATAKIFNQIADDCAGVLTFSAEAGRITYDATIGQKCMEIFEPFSDTAVCKNGITFNVQMTCQGTIKGTQPEGEACRADYECVEGLWCKGAEDTKEGSCAKPVAIGQSCAATGTAVDNAPYGFGKYAHCVAGAYCSTATTTAKCAALGDIGDACTAVTECSSGKCYLGKCANEGPVTEGKECLVSKDCVRGLFCELDEAGTAGTCKPRLLEGGDCKLGDDRCKGICTAPDTSTPGTCASFCGSG
jgi:hypothetical protein